MHVLGRCRVVDVTGQTHHIAFYPHPDDAARIIVTSSACCNLPDIRVARGPHNDYYYMDDKLIGHTLVEAAHAVINDH